MVKAGESATLSVTLDTLLDAHSGDITITLNMPAGLDTESASFYYTYTIAGTGQRSEFSYALPSPQQGTVDASGNGTIVIDADTIGLYQGSYLITVTAFDQATEGASSIVRKGVEVMRLVAGLPASGEISLDSQIISDEGFQVAVTDKIGNRLDLGNATYDSFAEDMTITVDYSAVSTDTPVAVYVDGEKKTSETDYTATPSGSSVAFKFTSMASGRHIVTFILDEADTELGVGSLTVEVNIPTDINITGV